MSSLLSDLSDPLPHVVYPGRTIVLLWLALRTFYADMLALIHHIISFSQASSRQEHTRHIMICIAMQKVSARDRLNIEKCADFNKQLPSAEQDPG